MVKETALEWCGFEVGIREHLVGSRADHRLPLQWTVTNPREAKHPAKSAGHASASGGAQLGAELGGRGVGVISPSTQTLHYHRTRRQLRAGPLRPLIIAILLDIITYTMDSRSTAPASAAQQSNSNPPNQAPPSYAPRPAAVEDDDDDDDDDDSDDDLDGKYHVHRLLRIDPE